jgi:Tfp pilus assembly protein PilO
LGDIAGSGALKVTVTTGVTGTYVNIQKYIDAIPALDRFVQIDQFSLLTDKATGLVSAQITAFAYYLPASK